MTGPTKQQIDDACERMLGVAKLVDAAAPKNQISKDINTIIAAIVFQRMSEEKKS